MAERLGNDFKGVVLASFTRNLKQQHLAKVWECSLPICEAQ
jgi:hypothetical protein